MDHDYLRDTIASAPSPRKMSKKSTQRSNIWKYFIKQANGTQANCLLCRKLFNCSHGTSNLHKHLHKIHPIESSSVAEENQEKSTEQLIYLIL